MSSSTAAPRLRWLPAAVLVLGLISTMGAAITLGQASQARAAARFETSMAQMRATISSRIEVHISLLHGVAGLYAASDEVTWADFQAYAQRLNLEQNYPGVQGVGFSAVVPAAERTALEQRARAMGLEGFRIWPPGPRAEYHTILYLAPLDERNRVALGYDMFTEATRREAMERARDTGMPAASGAVTLVQEIDEQKQAGFLIYLPIYRGGTMPASVAERREQLVGYAYSPFRADDLFQGIFSRRDLERISFALYDGGSGEPDALLHQSALSSPPGYRPTFTAQETLIVAGRPWTVTYSSQPFFDATGDAYVAPLALAVGIPISLISYLLVQAQTMARHQAELAVRARDSFLSVASHELKTPLTALYGNVQLLQRRAARDERLDDGVRRSVGAVIDQSRRLTKLVDQLLDHTRLQADRLHIERRHLELVELLERVVTEIRPTLTRHSLTIRSRDEELSILGDILRMEQVFFNLISNAVKYSPSGGLVEVAAARAGAWVQVEVIDHGIGIPAEALPQLFKQFYRAPNAVKQSINGMGIGLYVVKEIVERHGGTIVVTSVEGQGSTFTVRLPLAEGAGQLSAPAHQSDPPLPMPRQ